MAHLVIQKGKFDSQTYTIANISAAFYFAEGWQISPTCNDPLYKEVFIIHKYIYLTCAKKCTICHAIYQDICDRVYDCMLKLYNFSKYRFSTTCLCAHYGEVISEYWTKSHRYLMHFWLNFSAAAECKKVYKTHTVDVTKKQV